MSYQPPSSERRPSMAERRPSNLSGARPQIVPQLAYLELPPPSTTPEQVDVLVAGTGLVESILASALAWNGSNVLHIDSNPYYGDSSATLTVEQLKDWVRKVNIQKVGYKSFKNASLYIPRLNQHKIVSKNYGIDLSPKILFAKSDLLSLLIKSKVYKYLEFQSLSSFHVFENDSFEKLSSSKQDIFLNQSLSLQIKRNLMKFIKFVINWEVEREVWEPFRNASIQDFLTQKFKLESAQSNEIIFSLGLCTNTRLRTPEALQRIKRYLISFDVYGSFPVLYSKYGGPGELSQGFCRSAAVAGTTYKLGTEITNYNDTTNIVTLSDNTQIKVNERLVISPSQVPNFLDDYYSKTKKPSVEVNRMVVVVTKDCKEWVEENESAGIVVFPEGSLKSNNKFAVQVVVMNGGSEICPDGQAVWYLSTIEQGAKAREDLENALKLLEECIIRESNIDNIVTNEDIEFKNGMPSISSVKLGSSLMNFSPKEKLNYILKLSYTQLTSIPHFGVANPKLFDINEEQQSSQQQSQQQDSLNNDHKNNSPTNDTSNSSSNKILFDLMPSSELSYDGVITEAKVLYSKITGSDDDFFDVDFEDDDDDTYKASATAVTNESAAYDDDDDDDVLVMEDMTTGAVSPNPAGSLDRRRNTDEAIVESEDEIII